ncbi:alginate O-acetyltransferase complex protein AlgI [Oribacterium sinus]|uniref:Alginate O-acetyltransferase complex protein AlgI n=1 Tax=Oribacterium sinus TaxID=237576 RepID=A0A7W9SFQ9_9FIRM|nr:MBOAT family O-acyltransferase [Oribacterium sinus]MBB6041289.1 alginate O-acetyltransferase complex protein AlgI [Oribacterium sinus]
MQFSQMIFVAGFLPLFFVLYFGKKELAWKNAVFFLASCFFLLFQGLLAVAFLCFFTLFVFFMGKALERATEGKKKKIFFLSLAGILLPLAFFKYSAALPFLPKMVKGWMPFGISFYSFRFIAYLYDCYQGKEAEQDIFSFSLFAFAFPVLSQGPILRYSEIREEIKNRAFSYEAFSHGLFRFTFGLWKKLALADALGSLSVEVLSLDSLKNASMLQSSSPSFSFLAVFLSGISYMLQIFLDFSAYTDMAIGIGEICGFTLPENFQAPYSARSIRDFWRRWHISLSMFFRDYVYIPLGGNRVPFPLQVRNLLLIWVLTGIWHGSTANFILWGLYFFVFILLELCCKKLWKRMKKSEGGNFSFVLRCLQHVYTLVVLYFSWILFRFSDFQSLKNILWLHTLPKSLALVDGKTLLIVKSNIFLLLVAILFSGNLLSSLEEEWQKLLFRGKSRLARKKRASLGFYGMEDSEEDSPEAGTDSPEAVVDTPEVAAIDAGEAALKGVPEATADESIFAASSDRKDLFPEEKYPMLKLSLDGEGAPRPEEISGETEVQKEEAISLAEEAEAELSQENQEDLLRHEKILRRIQRRTKLSIFFLDHAEQLYFWGKLLAAIAFLLLSFALMAGQSYMPFLYNQF